MSIHRIYRRPKSSGLASPSDIVPSSERPGAIKPMLWWYFGVEPWVRCSRSIDGTRIRSRMAAHPPWRQAHYPFPLALQPFPSAKVRCMQALNGNRTRRYNTWRMASSMTAPRGASTK